LKVDRQKFIEALNKRLDDLKTDKQTPESVPLEKVIIYIVDKLKAGTFEGFISIKVKGTSIYSPRVEETTVLNREYMFLE
jgi:hypothetical protein